MVVRGQRSLWRHVCLGLVSVRKTPPRKCDHLGHKRPLELKDEQIGVWCSAHWNFDVIEFNPVGQRWTSPWCHNVLWLQRSSVPPGSTCVWSICNSVRSYRRHNVTFKDSADTTDQMFDLSFPINLSTAWASSDWSDVRCGAPLQQGVKAAQVQRQR